MLDRSHGGVHMVRSDHNAETSFYLFEDVIAAMYAMAPAASTLNVLEPPANPVRSYEPCSTDSDEGKDESVEPRSYVNRADATSMFGLVRR